MFGSVLKKEKPKKDTSHLAFCLARALASVPGRVSFFRVPLVFQGGTQREQKRKQPLLGGVPSFETHPTCEVVSQDNNASEDPIELAKGQVEVGVARVFFLHMGTGQN